MFPTIRTRCIFLLGAGWLAWLLVVWPCGAGAHTTSISYSYVAAEEGELAYTLVVNPHILAVALGIETDLETPVPQAEFEVRQAAIERYLRTRLRVSRAGSPCAMEPFSPVYEQLPEAVGLPLRFVCPGGKGPIEISFALFFDIDPTHRSIGRLTTPEWRKSFVFDSFKTELSVAVGEPEDSASIWGIFGRWSLMGVEHILAGYDHLLFLFALIAISTRFWQLLKVVTAFTVAHSLTLALAWLGVVSFPGRWVESLIALSIAYVALENLFHKGAARRWLVGFAFGLVHGLGFYGVLSRLELARENAVPTLLAFNLGVEAGQIAVLAVIYPALVWGSGKMWYTGAQKWASAGILLVAGYWFFQRAFTS